jgi:hypothetical protein
MVPCDGPVAVVAPAEVNVELSKDDATWNLRLILRRDVGFSQLTAATVRALVRQWHVALFVDSRRWFAVSMLPMAFALLAPRLPWPPDRLFVFAKWCRLTLPLFAQALNLALQLGDSALKFRNPPVQTSILTPQFFVSWRKRRSAANHGSRPVHTFPTKTVKLAD